MTEQDRGFYFASREWALKKVATRKRSGGLCEHCKRHPSSQVHHVTYSRFGKELPDDLLDVCERCHLFLSGKSHWYPGMVEDAVASKVEEPACMCCSMTESGGADFISKDSQGRYCCAFCEELVYGEVQ